jgi:hypothetical protein
MQGTVLMLFGSGVRVIEDVSQYPKVLGGDPQGVGCLETRDYGVDELRHYSTGVFLDQETYAAHH